MKVFKILIFIIILNSKNILYTQNLILKELIPVYETCNYDFKLILDSFIINEQKYKYYNNNTIFPICINNINNDLIIFISSGGSTDTIMRYEKVRPKQIFLYYNNHFFKVVLRNCLIEKSLFIETNRKKEIYYKKEKRKKKIKKRIIEIEVEKDEYWITSWIYKYSNNSFFLIEKSPAVNLEIIE